MGQVTGAVFLADSFTDIQLIGGSQTHLKKSSYQTSFSFIWPFSADFAVN
jgi:hypothetical protein